MSLIPTNQNRGVVPVPRAGPVVAGRPVVFAHDSLPSTQNPYLQELAAAEAENMALDEELQRTKKRILPALHAAHAGGVAVGVKRAAAAVDDMDEVVRFQQDRMNYLEQELHHETNLAAAAVVHAGDLHDALQATQMDAVQEQARADSAENVARLAVAQSQRATAAVNTVIAEAQHEIAAREAVIEQKDAIIQQTVNDAHKALDEQRENIVGQAHVALDQQQTDLETKAVAAITAAQNQVIEAANKNAQELLIKQHDMLEKEMYEALDAQHKRYEDIIKQRDAYNAELLAAHEAQLEKNLAAVEGKARAQLEQAIAAANAKLEEESRTYLAKMEELEKRIAECDGERNQLKEELSEMKTSYADLWNSQLSMASTQELNAMPDVPPSDPTNPTIKTSEFPKVPGTMAIPPVPPAIPPAVPPAAPPAAPPAGPPVGPTRTVEELEKALAESTKKRAGLKEKADHWERHRIEKLKALKKAESYWKRHPRAEKIDKSIKAKTVVKYAKDYVPGKNDFLGVDTAKSSGRKVKFS